MIWTAATLELHSLSQTQRDADDTFHFVAKGLSFAEGKTQLVFIRANIEANDGLKPYQIVPCSHLSVSGTPGEQLASFRATFAEREGGTYHLVAWNPSAEGVNQACVLEWVIGVASVPGQPTEVVIKAPEE